MNKNLFFIRSALLVAMLAGWFGLAASLRAQPLVTYDIFTADSSVAPTIAATASALNVTGSPLTTTGVSPLDFDIGFDGHFFFKNWHPSATVDPNDDYYSFTITPDAGFQLNLTSVSYTLAQNGAPTWELRSSVDSFSVPLAVHTVVSGPGAFQDSFSDSVSSLGTQSAAVTFRLYGYSETGTAFQGLANNDPELGGDHGQNLVVSGTISAVPEPHEYDMIAGLGLLAFVVYRHRNRTRKLA